MFAHHRKWCSELTGYTWQRLQGRKNLSGTDIRSLCLVPSLLQPFPPYSSWRSPSMSLIRALTGYRCSWVQHQMPASGSYPAQSFPQSLHIQLRSRPTAGPTMGPAKFSFFSSLEKGLKVKLAVLCNSIVYFGSGLKVNNSREDGNRIICFCIWVQVGAKCCFC